MKLMTYRLMILKILLVASFGLITLSSAYGLERIRWKVQVIANSGYWVDLWKGYVENVKLFQMEKSDSEYMIPIQLFLIIKYGKPLLMIS